jgi:hypothetical protein
MADGSGAAGELLLALLLVLRCPKQARRPQSTVMPPPCRPPAAPYTDTSPPATLPHTHRSCSSARAAAPSATGWWASLPRAPTRPCSPSRTLASRSAWRATLLTRAQSCATRAWSAWTWARRASRCTSPRSCARGCLPGSAGGLAFDVICARGCLPGSAGGLAFDVICARGCLPGGLGGCL